MYQEGKDQDEAIRNHVDGTCWRCGVPVVWDNDDLRASDIGSFVDENLGFECPDGKLHQG